MSECKNSCKDCKCNEVSDPERRRFMGWMIGIFNGIVGIAVIGPVIGFIGAPLKLRSKPIWVDVIGLDEIVDGETKEASFNLVVKDGFRKVNRTYKTFMRRTGDSVTAYNPACTHLGCRVDYQADKERYFCPCHGGVFSQDGKVVAGPPPRPLEEYETKIEDGRVMVLKEV